MTYIPKTICAFIEIPLFLGLHYWQSQKLIDKSNRNTSKLDNSRRLAQTTLHIGFPVPISDLGAAKTIKYEQKQYRLDRMIKIFCCTIWGTGHSRSSEKYVPENDLAGLRQHPYSWNSIWNWNACKGDIANANEHSLKRAQLLNEEIKSNLETMTFEEKKSDEFYVPEHSWKYSLDVLSNNLAFLGTKIHGCFINNECRLEQIELVLKASANARENIKTNLMQKSKDANKEFDIIKSLWQAKLNRIQTK